MNSFYQMVSQETMHCYPEPKNIGGYWSVVTIRNWETGKTKADARGMEL